MPLSTEADGLGNCFPSHLGIFQSFLKFCISNTCTLPSACTSVLLLGLWAELAADVTPNFTAKTCVQTALDSVEMLSMCEQ